MGREIRKGLAASATISYESHPRDLRDEKAARGVKRKKSRLGREAAGTQCLDTFSKESSEPVWGPISHPGWSSPCSEDLPNLHFEPVIVELSYLIEAKAVSLAPFDPLSSYEPDRVRREEEELEARVPDPVAVELLQRPASMGLRDYSARLAELGVLDLDPVASDFLTRYEYARYSGEELEEGEFRVLMRIFADVLRDMRALDEGIVDEVRMEMEEAEGDGGEGGGGRDAESVNTTETVQRTPKPEVYAGSSSSSSSFSSSSSSSSSSNASRSRGQGTIHIPPSRPAAMRDPSSRSRRSANRSVHQPSLSSLRRVRTDTSSSGYSVGSRAGSVIRLKEARGPLDLPYAILTGDGQEM